MSKIINDGGVDGAKKLKTYYENEKQELIKRYGFEPEAHQKPTENIEDAVSGAQDIDTEETTATSEEASDNTEHIIPNEYILDVLDDFSYLAAKQNGNGTSKLAWLKIWRWFEFVDMPSEMLTIMVVASMGALGGSISLTRVYLRPDSNQKTAEYFFRPLLGAITAFAVYVLAKAGVLIVSNNGTSGEGASLSPFFISFVGLMSGMLSEDALNTIQNVGGNWFKNSDEGIDRWGIGLAEKFEAKQISTKEIANLVKVPDDTVQKWLNEEEAIPAAKQELIAAWLQTSPRTLFSDMPPNKPKNGEALA